MIDLLVCNFYINSKSIYNSEKSTIKIWCQDLIFQQKLNLKIIICGDFNTPNINIPLYQNVIPSEINTFYRKQIRRTLISRTDHCLVRNFTNPQLLSSFNNLSDHCLINLSLNFQNNHHKEHKIIYSKKHAYNLNQEANKYTDFTCWYNYIRINLRNKKVISKQRITLSKYKAFNETLEQKLEQVAQNYQTSNNIAAFRTIKSIAILNPNKRDGGIFRCFKDEKGELQCGDICISNCLKQLGLISKSAPYKPMHLPSLPPLTITKVQELQKMMSRDKAITKDGISDTFIKQTKNIALLQDLWKNSTLETNIYLGEARLIPLNKSFPDIPSFNQFRPIVVMSPLFKYLELRFAKKLQDHILNNLTFNQAGFCPGKGTQENILQLIEQIQGNQKNQQLDVVFIDFSNAYNTVDRPKLYLLLKKKNILYENEVDFLIALHSQLYFKDPIHKKQFHWFENGVIQGSPISPSLFNIFLDQFLIEISQNFEQWFNVKAYADDLVFIVKHTNIKQFLKILEMIAKKWKLIVNKKKSGIFLLHNIKNINDKNILDYPIVQQYNYLGILIDKKASIQKHLNKLQGQLKAKTTKLKWICRKMPFYKQINIWKVYINSILNYSQPAVSFNKYKTTKLLIQQIRRNTMKHFLGIPNCAPNQYIEILMKSKVSQGLPNEIKELFYHGGELCVEHQSRAHCQHLLDYHLNFDQSIFLKYLQGNIKSKRSKSKIKNSFINMKQLELVKINDEKQKKSKEN